MIELLLGGARSGKSRLAEQRASDLETLINAADGELYTAKREGRDRFVWQP